MNKAAATQHPQAEAFGDILPFVVGSFHPDVQHFIEECV